MHFTKWNLYDNMEKDNNKQYPIKTGPQPHTKWNI